MAVSNHQFELILMPSMIVMVAAMVFEPDALRSRQARDLITARRRRTDVAPARPAVARSAALLALALTLASCGGGGSSGGGNSTSYSVGGTVSGLAGSGLVLQNNGGDNLTIAGAGPFAFATKVASGMPYAVSILTQPTGSGETCAVTNSTGTMGASDVTNVAVTCSGAYAVGGTVTGLVGSGLVLRNNGDDDLPLSANGPFSFATAIASGATYSVTIAAQPASPAQNCMVTNGTAQGTVGAAIVTGISVVCASVGRYLYTANLGDYSISGYSIDASTGALTAIPGSPYAGALKASYVAAEPSGKFLYALDNEGGSLGITAPGIDVYSIDANTGALTVVTGSPFPTDAGALSMTILASGRFAYTANVNSMSVSAYSLDAVTGAVAPVTGSPFASGSFPFMVATDTAGKFAYAANDGGVWAYAIDANSGALTAVAGSPFMAGSGSRAISVVPGGGFAYVANNVSNDVSAFAIASGSGALAPIAGSPYAAGLSPTGTATDPSGTFLYVANSNGGGVPGASNVSGYRIAAGTGALTAVPGSPFATDFLPVAIAIDRSGKFLYVANGDPPANNISAFAIDANTGRLTAVAGSPFAAGPNPQSITVSN